MIYTNPQLSNLSKKKIGSLILHAISTKMSMKKCIRFHEL